MMRPVPIPISQAKRIADEFGYDQVMIYARKVDRPAGVGETASQAIQGGEHMTTYGIDAKNCAAAAQIGDFLKFKIMGWNEEETHEDRRYEALTKALTEAIEVAYLNPLVETMKRLSENVITHQPKK